MVVVMVDMEAMVDMDEDTDMDANEEVPMLKPMPTTDMVVVMVDMEVMVADMVDTDTDVNADLLMLTMDMVMAVNLASSQFIKPKSNYTTSFQHTKEYIQKAKSQPLHCIYQSYIPIYSSSKTSNQCR